MCVSSNTAALGQIPTYLTAICRVYVDQSVFRRFHRRVRVPICSVNHLLLSPVHLISTVHYLSHCASFKMHLQSMYVYNTETC